MENSNFFRSKSVLVAGGTGTIGIPLVKLLLEHGANVTVVSMDTKEYAHSVLGTDVQFEQDDLTELAACEHATKRKDYVFNMVGIKGSVGIGETKAASYFVPMLRFQTNLMDAAFRNDVSRYLFVSSVCAYPQATLHVEENMWNGLPKQNDKYPGLAKRIGEVQGETYLKEYGWDAVRIVRPSNVYGPYDDFNSSTAQVVPALIRRMTDGENPVRVWGDGTVVRDFIFSEDVAYWSTVALEHAPACHPVNLGSGRGCTIRELATVVASTVPQHPRIEWDPDMPGGDPVRLMSMERAKAVLGYYERTTLEQGIRKTVDWFLANSKLACKARELRSE